MSKNEPILPQTVPAEQALDIAVRVVRDGKLLKNFLLFENAKWHDSEHRDIYIPALDMVVQRVAQTFACLIRREVGAKKFARIRAANRILAKKDGRSPINKRCASNAFTNPDECLGEAIKDVLGRVSAEGDYAEIIMLHVWPRAWRAANLR